jgi:hypothetical protein
MICAPIILLAIDPAAVSGWATFIRGEYRASGIATTMVDRADVLRDAVFLSQTLDLPLIVIAESWTFGGSGKDPRATAAMQAGLMSKWGLWEAAIEESRASNAIKVVRVNSRRWQSSVLTRLRVNSATLKQIAKHSASNIARHPIEDENEADAICIGFYGSIAPEVVAKVSIAEGRRLGIDVTAARERVKAEKQMKRAAKARRRAA